MIETVKMFGLTFVPLNDVDRDNFTGAEAEYMRMFAGAEDGSLICHRGETTYLLNPERTQISIFDAERDETVWGSMAWFHRFSAVGNETVWHRTTWFHRFAGWLRSGFSVSDDITRLALDSTIGKWRAVVNGYPEEGDCALCYFFLEQRHPCRGCPVAARTGENFCDGTPYVEWLRCCQENTSEYSSPDHA